MDLQALYTGSHDPGMFKNGKQVFNWNETPSQCHKEWWASRSSDSLVETLSVIVCLFGLGVLSPIPTQAKEIYRHVHSSTASCRWTCEKRQSEDVHAVSARKSVSEITEPNEFVETERRFPVNWLVFIGRTEWTLILQWPSQDPGTRLRENTRNNGFIMISDW